MDAYLKKKKISLNSSPPIWNPGSVPDTYNHIHACELLWIWQGLLGCILGCLDSWNHRTHWNKWSLSLVVMEPRDGYTYWVMDIQPYPIQMFRVIPGFLWVELNWVGYRYYLNCSGRVWILSKPDPYLKKKKKKKKKKKPNLSHYLSLSLLKLSSLHLSSASLSLSVSMSPHRFDQGQRLL